MRGIVRIVRFVFFLAILGMVAVFVFAAPIGRQYAAMLERYIDRTQNLAYFRSGKPLIGTPALEQYTARLARQGVREGAPVFVRIFKQESELELWLHNGTRFVLFATYPICYWSGSLGPKLKEGDRQSPEGFYTVAASQLNPKSRYYRSFNLGFPNSFDRSHRRTGSFLMVHGSCVSIGCYAMTDPVIAEVWRLITAAFKNGQRRFSVHAFPFRMTTENLDWYADPNWNSFWSDLKQGHDLFEQAHVPPRIATCNRRYVALAGKPGSLGDVPLRENCAALTRR